MSDWEAMRTGLCRSLPRIAGAWGGIALACATHAADAPEQQYFADLPVVLSVSKLPQTLADTPGAVTVIDREAILSLGAASHLDLPRLLRVVPGFNAVRDNAHTTLVSYHGLASDSPNRLQVLVDGRSVYSPYLLGVVDWSALPLTVGEIDRIEIVRGSNSTTYGSNAFLGVVNIVTRHSGVQAGGDVMVGGGTQDSRVASARLARQFGDLSVALGAQTRRSSGFSQKQDSFGLSALTVRADWRASSRDELTLWAGEHAGWRGNGYPDSANNANGLRDAVTRNYFVHLRWRRSLSPTEEIEVGYYRNRDRAREEWTGFLPPLFPVIPIDFNRTSTRDNIDLQHTFSPADGVRMVWGAEARRDELVSPRLFFEAGRDASTLGRLFANVEWIVRPALTLNAGNMWERYGGRAARNAPRVFLNWHPAEGQTLRAGYSRAFRQPSLVEEDGDSRFVAGGVLIRRTLLGGGRLEPERVNTLELGYLGRLGGRATLDVRLFREALSSTVVSNAAVMPPPVGLFTTGVRFEQGPSATLRGLEYQFRAKPSHEREIWFSHTLARIGASDPQVQRSVPPYSASLTWFERLPRDWSTALTLRRVGPLHWGGGGQPLPAYHAFDLRVARRFAAVGVTWEAALDVLDGGPSHAEFRDNNVPRNPVSRQTMISLRAAWH